MKVKIGLRSYFVEPVPLSGRSVRLLGGGSGVVEGVRFGAACSEKNAFIIREDGRYRLASRSDFELTGAAAPALW